MVIWCPTEIAEKGVLGMRIALIGATGQAGSEILAELSRRGHAVTAIVRASASVNDHAAVQDW